MLHKWLGATEDVQNENITAREKVHHATLWCKRTRFDNGCYHTVKYNGYSYDCIVGYWGFRICNIKTLDSDAED